MVHLSFLQCYVNLLPISFLLVDLHFYGNEEEQHLEVRVIPAVQSNYTTDYADSAEEQERIYNFLESISINVEIDEEGIVTEKTE